ncbi:AzlC family ABC transporter permease, partial [Halostella sp. PRR32]|uniref:AzlC family ABC transporter permease n=1 Tax=Halostella sp. PRR32 TaxID=3098147 RepID=UPI002B1E0599
VAALPGGGWAALSAASLMGVRNAIYGAQMNAELAPRPWWRRAAAAQITIDESVAVAMAQLEPTERRRGFWLTGVGVYVFWNLLTFVGAFAAGR